MTNWVIKLAKLKTKSIPSSLWMQAEWRSLSQNWILLPSKTPSFGRKNDASARPFQSWLKTLSGSKQGCKNSYSLKPWPRNYPKTTKNTVMDATKGHLNPWYVKATRSQMMYASKLTIDTPKLIRNKGRLPILKLLGDVSRNIGAYQLILAFWNCRNEAK